MEILLADDHGLFRDSMSVWLKQLNEDISFDFSDSYSSTEKLLRSSKKYALVMIDLSMPGMQGMLSITQLCSLSGKTPLLVVSADESVESIKQSMNAGAAGYVTKSSPGEKIIQAARIVIDGGLYFPRESNDITSSGLEEFTHKQLELLALLAEGKSNREIAENLCLSENTVKQYVSQILKLLEVDNRSRAGIKARELLRIGTS